MSSLFQVPKPPPLPRYNQPLPLFPSNSSWKATHPLHEATKAKGQASTWTPECQLALESAKSALISSKLLLHPHTPPLGPTSLWMPPTKLLVASWSSFRTVFGFRLPFSFASSPMQKKYSAFDCKLLAIYGAIKFFCHFFEGQAFTMYMHRS